MYNERQFLETIKPVNLEKNVYHICESEERFMILIYSVQAKESVNFTEKINI